VTDRGAPDHRRSRTGRSLSAAGRLVRTAAGRLVRTAAGRVDEIDGWVFDQQARSHTPVATAVLPKLTHAADHSVLWMGAAFVIAVAGGDRGRRAATTGLLSIATASLLSNQVGKGLLPRRRPALHRVPVDRQSRRRPLSTSFPSGHSASAAAFATGVSLELPVLAVPLGVTATAVCWSRVYTGVHYPFDVLAGAALGVGCGAIVHRLRRS
jgi:membrane-associated phospholipid phosphatase